MLAKPFDLLVVALLSVNSYPIEMTLADREALGKAGLLDIGHVASLEEAEITHRLRRAGYDRGEFLTELIGSRLSSVSKYLVQIGIEKSHKILEHGPREEVHSVLINAKGIGPKVIANFLLLRSLELIDAKPGGDA